MASVSVSSSESAPSSMSGTSGASARDTESPRNSPAPMTRCMQSAPPPDSMSASAGWLPPTLQPAGQSVPNPLHDGGHAPAQRPPRGRVRIDGLADRHLDPPERPEAVRAADRSRHDRHACLQCEVPDAHLEWADRPPARVAAFGKHEHDAAAREYLVDGSQAGLVQLS